MRLDPRWPSRAIARGSDLPSPLARNCSHCMTPKCSVTCVPTGARCQRCATYTAPHVDKARKRRKLSTNAARKSSSVAAAVARTLGRSGVQAQRVDEGAKADPSAFDRLRYFVRGDSLFLHQRQDAVRRLNLL